MVRISSLFAVLAIFFCFSGRFWAQTTYQPAVPGVSDGAAPTNDHTTEADKEQAGRARDDSTIVNQIAIRFKDGQVNPGKTGMIAGAPDDVLHVERAAVRKDRQAVTDIRQAR